MLQLHNSTTQTVYSLTEGTKHLWNPALLKSTDMPNYKKYKRSTEVDDSSFPRLSTRSCQRGMEADTLSMTDQRLAGLLHQTCSTLVINTIWILINCAIIQPSRFGPVKDIQTKWPNPKKSEGCTTPPEKSSSSLPSATGQCNFLHWVETECGMPRGWSKSQGQRS